MDMDMKKYLLNKIDRQASLSIIKYRKNNLYSAGIYFHTACEFGVMYGKFFVEEEVDAEFRYIDIFHKVCERWDVDYRTWFDAMCDYVYVKGC